MDRRLLVLLAGAATSRAVNFPYETVQLTPADTTTFPDIAFGTPQCRALPEETPCKEFPGSPDWPSPATWSQLNDTLGGALLQPVPAAAACYTGPYFNPSQCDFLVNTANKTRFWIDDPLTMLSDWAQGNTCMVSRTPVGTCTRGGFPEYVVNATTVRHVQAAVNFARNRNIRLVVKNTGHDFGGRSGGSGSLSVWVHNMKGTEFLPSYTVGSYTGMAVRIAAGVEAWEVFNNVMGIHNVTVVAPEWSSVGMAGGWLQGAGHGNVVGTYGLGADNALAFQVVLADGSFVTADPDNNSNLFWALRGGGGGTYGIVTSVILKAHAQSTMATSKLEFYLPPTPAPPAGSIPPNTIIIHDPEQFWAAVSIYFKFSARISSAGGLSFGWINLPTFGGFNFTSTNTLINTAPSIAHDMHEPLYDALAEIGLRLPNPPINSVTFFGTGGRSPNGKQPQGPNQTRYRSRLFPKTNWQDETLFNATMAAIRLCSESGYRFHHNMHEPLREVGAQGGWIGEEPAVLPAYRKAVMHAMIQEQQLVRPSKEEQMAADERVGRVMDAFRAVALDSGAYMNEGDPGEPGWQRTFYGENYPRLLEVKKRYDPCGVFWAPTTVGSEGWEVRVEDGVPDRQNGRLCLAGDGPP